MVMEFSEAHFKGFSSKLTVFYTNSQLLQQQIAACTTAGAVC
jgi:hypothetical protein